MLYSHSAIKEMNILGTTPYLDLKEIRYIGGLAVHQLLFSNAA